MSTPFKIAVAGLGTVGAAVVAAVQRHGALFEARSGHALEITAVAARDRNRNRPIDISPYPWFDDPVAMAKEADADLVVELIGGADGVAKAMIEAAITSGRHVVTANKALLAHHGNDLAHRADAAGVALAFEAAVAGGIPIVKAMREGLAANNLSRVFGILNGTSNYILSNMRETGRAFAEVLEEAQQLGYAETDPSFDVDGVDAAHKLALLTSLAFGAEVNFSAVHVEGIRHVSIDDIEFAAELGYRIKLLATARLTPNGVEQRVHPCMVGLDSPVAYVDGVFNAIVAEGDLVGSTVYEGRGAGGGPTSSAVVADLIDIARGRRVPAFAVPANRLKPIPTARMEDHVGPYYVRFTVIDQPGVIADIAATFRDENVSMEGMLQRGRNPGDVVSVVLTTHDTQEASMSRALDRIARLDSVVEPPRMIRIEPTLEGADPA
ncbi:MAG: homoserine dehydrogenase [Alphaproteobacteria bacterium]|nr:homoserine dehydrogenase [Alphaproteobacteria bacterium]